MALIRRTAALTTTPADIYVCGAGIEASAHGITLANYTASDVMVYVEFFNSTTATTTFLWDALVSANKTTSLPKPINMRPGDKIIASAGANTSADIQVSVYEDSAGVAVGFTLQGTWSAAVTYAVNDVVYYNGSSYAALQASLNQNPASATAYWELFSEKGDTGTIAVGATTTVNPNVNPSVTNTGTSTAANFVFSLPRASAVSVPASTTVNPNVNPSVTNSGTNGDTVLNFSLPRAPAVTVGATTTLNAGASATVTPTTTNGDVSLAFGIPQGEGYANQTSATSNTIGTGSKTFTVGITSANSAFAVNQRVRVSNSATNWMEGVITAYSGTSMTVNVDLTGGSGTFSAWAFSIAGERGATGLTGPIGPKGITILDPIGTESVTLFYTTAALTISAIRGVVTGTSPSTTVTVYSGPSRGTITDTHATGAVTSTTTGTSLTVTDTSVAAGSWVWVVLSSQTGTVTSVNVTVEFVA